MKIQYHVYIEDCDSFIIWAKSALELPQVILKNFPEYKGLNGYAVDECGESMQLHV